jgi:hypothetical protein
MRPCRAFCPGVPVPLESRIAPSSWSLNSILETLGIRHKHPKAVASPHATAAARARLLRRANLQPAAASAAPIPVTTIRSSAVAAGPADGGTAAHDPAATAAWNAANQARLAAWGLSQRGPSA